MKNPDPGAARPAAPATSSAADEVRHPSDIGEKRPHVYDGIEEYDKRLPNWWLQTLYWAIAFSVVYWALHFQSTFFGSDGKRVETEMIRLAGIRANALDLSDPDIFWKMAAEQADLLAGEEIYKANCASCHGPDLRGKDAGAQYIGANLVDTQWTNGNAVLQIFGTINDGIAAKGMPAWKTLLGPKKIAQVQAYIFSHHQRGPDGTPAPREGATTTATAAATSGTADASAPAAILAALP